MGVRMARDSNLTRRGAVYYARIFVPKDLRDALGKSEIRPSLHTSDYVEAKRRKAAIVDQWTATFDDMRRRSTLSDADIAAAVWDHYSSALDAGDRERASRATTTEIEAAVDKGMAEARASGASELGGIAMINAMTEANVLAHAPDWAARRREGRLTRLRSDLASGDTRLIEPDVDQFVSRHGFGIERGGEQYRDLCHKLMRAEIEQLQRHAERDRGDYTGKPTDPIVVKPASSPELLDATGETIMALFAKYEKENPNSIRQESLKQARRDVKLFADFVGPRVRAGEIGKRHVREWKDLLADYPVKASETTIFKHLSLAEIVASNRTLDVPKPTLSRQTVRRYLSSLSGFCEWLVQNDYLDTNPVTGMVPKKAPPTNKPDPFTDGQLATLFGSPLFTTCRSEEWSDLHQPGNAAVRDHRFWIPWIMLYSGARPGEIAQLHVADVREQHGMWTMHIGELGDDDKRTVPCSGRASCSPATSRPARLSLPTWRTSRARPSNPA